MDVKQLEQFKLTIYDVKNQFRQWVYDRSVEAFRKGDEARVCQYLVHAGLVVFAIDPTGQGERLDYYDPISRTSFVPPGTGEHDQAGSQSLALGDGIARYFIYDAMRAIDYLCTRPEVDPAKIGVTGNSGGGTQTSMLIWYS